MGVDSRSQAWLDGDDFDHLARYREACATTGRDTGGEPTGLAFTR